MDKEKRLDCLEKSSRVRKYTELIAMAYSLSETLDESDDMKKYLADVAKKLCGALEKVL